MVRKVFALALVLAIAMAACTSAGDDDSSTDAPSPGTSSAAPGFDVVLTDVSELVKAVQPSVVTITQTQLRLDALGSVAEVPAGAGTGVVIDRQGHVLTNAHVVAGAQSVVVVGHDGAPRRAQVVGTWGADQNSDLALLLLDDPAGLVPITSSETSVSTTSNPGAAEEVAGDVVLVAAPSSPEEVQAAIAMASTIVAANTLRTMNRVYGKDSGVFGRALTGLICGNGI